MDPVSIFMNKIGHLVLTIKTDEVIQIGPDVKLTFKKIGQKHLRVHFDAPKTTQIYRVKHDALTNGPISESSEENLKELSYDDRT